MTAQFDALAKKYDADLDDELDRGAVVEGARGRVLAASGVRKASSRRWAGAGALAAVLLLSVWFGSRLMQSRGELSMRAENGARQSLDGRWIATHATTSRLEFSDGSTMRLDPHTNLRITATGPHRAVVQLERGAAAFDIHHAPSTQWLVEVGPIRVLVVGTRFTVRWLPDDQVMVLALSDGQVRVDGSFFGSQLVSAGQQFVVNVPAHTSTLSDRSSDALSVREPARTTTADGAVTSDRAGVVTAVGDAAVNAVAPRAVPAAVRWQSLALDARYQEAWDAVRRHGVAVTVERSSTDDLLLFARVARLAGEPNAAKLALTRVLARRPRSAVGAAAMFDLGRIAADIERDPVEALRWFEQLSQSDPQGRWAEESVGRAIECARRAGQRARARELAASYLRRWPTGSFASFARATEGGP
jgi:hypothetical protein